MSKTFENELYHYGVKGMKRGIRRFQNEDGTLTEAGRARYNTRSESFESRNYGDSARRAMQRMAANHLQSQMHENMKTVGKNDKLINKFAKKADKLSAKKINNRRQKKLDKYNDTVKTAKTYNKTLSNYNKDLSKKLSAVQTGKAVAGKDYKVGAHFNKKGVLKTIGSNSLGGYLGMGVYGYRSLTNKNHGAKDLYRLTWNEKNRKKRK